MSPGESRAAAMPEPTTVVVSHHLKVLRDAGIVGSERQGLWAFYYVIPDALGDCGIFNLGTLAAARRRGIGTALTTLQLREARERGCTTASLQSTPIAAGVHAALGFADLGRYLEYVPAP